MATQSNSELQREAQLNQAVDYSEILNELAKQRHTVVTNHLNSSVTFTGHRLVVERNDKLLADIDSLIRDILSHIAGTDLITTDPDTNIKDT